MDLRGKGLYFFYYIVPREIRQKLDLNEGTKILFYQNELGQVVIENANINIFHDIKNAIVKINKINNEESLC